MPTMIEEERIEEERIEEEYYIREYNYIPEYSYFYNYKNLIISSFYNEECRYYGLELECESKGRGRYDVKNYYRPFVYYKRDGSLNDGVELVTHPCEYDVFKSESFRSLIIDLNEEFKSHDTDTCGLHVHVSRREGYLQETFWQRIIFSNKELVNKFFIPFSRRKDNHYCQYFLDNDNYGGKYVAANTRHSDTIEIRIFRGTLKYETILASIQLVKLIESYLDNFLKNNDNGYNYPNITLKNLKRKIKKEKGIYPELYSYCMKKNLLGGKK